MGNQDQYKQGDRKANSEGEGFDSPVALALVPHEKQQRGSKTGDNEDERNGDKDLHDGTLQSSSAAIRERVTL
jgi:hypothetical protein